MRHISGLNHVAIFVSDLDEILLDTPKKMEYYVIWSYGIPHTVPNGKQIP